MKVRLLNTDDTELGQIDVPRDGWGRSPGTWASTIVRLKEKDVFYNLGPDYKTVSGDNSLPAYRIAVGIHWA